MFPSVIISRNLLFASFHQRSNLVICNSENCHLTHRKEASQKLVEFPSIFYSYANVLIFSGTVLLKSLRLKR